MCAPFQLDPAVAKAPKTYLSFKVLFKIHFWHDILRKTGPTGACWDGRGIRDASAVERNTNT